MRGRRDRRISELSIYSFRRHRASDAVTVFYGRRTHAEQEPGIEGAIAADVSSFPLDFASNPLRFPGGFSNFMAAFFSFSRLLVKPPPVAREVL
jgi:hypothetical protein